jgi:hypothetical protein
VKYLHRVKYRVGLALCSLAITASGSVAAAQQTTATDTVRADRPDTTRPVPADTSRPPIGVRVRLGGDTLPFRLPSIRRTAERESYIRAREQIAEARATAFQQNMRAVLEATWGQVAAQTFATARVPPGFPGEPRRRVPTVGERAATVLEDYTDLAVQLNSRVEIRGEQTRNARCAPGVAFDPIANCRSGFEPLFEFQSSLRAGGVISDRVNVNVDYDSQREFESSNNISIAYSGKGQEFLERFEVGSVSFLPPRSQFITAGIPSNNTGLQAITRVGPLRIRGILAQQKGHVVRDRTFTVGDRTLKAVDRAIEDYQFEPRRFFFTVDPKLLLGYPNIDLLDQARMAQLAASLPDTLRPSRLSVYRLLIGGQPPNPSGPQFSILGDPRSRRGQVYEYMREGVDYYADPSLLWIALVRPLSLNNERLVLAYHVRIAGQDTVHVTTGGTPDIEFVAEREQFANLLWDPQVQPGDPAFDREIRSIYRLGGSDVIRGSVSLKVVTGPNEDQERPVRGPADTYLQLFGLAQATNSSSFDVDNRLWPRATDPNVQISFASPMSQTLRDQFIVFPSVRPFAANGFTRGNPANDTVYTTPAEHFSGPRRPQTIYYLRARYQTEGGGEGGTIMLGSVQLRPNSERIAVDGMPLVRGVDYVVDYELGRVSFAGSDTLFFRPRQVTVSYEENPLFADTPTSILGGTAELLLENGEITFTALSQRQRTTFTRPSLGFEPASTFIAGFGGNFSLEAEPLRRAVSRLPWGETGVPARVNLSAEVAMSFPKPNAAGQAYLESFEGEGGIPVNLEDRTWYYSSQPALGQFLGGTLGGSVLDLNRASTLAWQSSGVDLTGRVVTYSIGQIDPQTELFGAGVSAPEPVLWLTLYPLAVRGLYEPETRQFRWRSVASVAGRRWRSIRTPLGPSGTDLTRVENIEFWAQIPLSSGARGRAPVLVLDFGEVSENSVAFQPEGGAIRAPSPGSEPDTTLTGARLAGFDRLDSERDPFSRAFNVAVNDLGLPGDRADSITMTIDTLGAPFTEVKYDFPVCNAGFRIVYAVGDNRVNCTIGNNRLDEEDIDGDNVLNLDSSERNLEQWRRYVVDLATAQFTRRGVCSAPPQTVGGVQADSVCWVFFRIPFRSPQDSLGNPLLRRTRALRITVISSASLGEQEFSQVAIARLRLTGAPWLKRDDRALRGISGADPAGGFVAASTIGTQDRNVPGRPNYESPPGVIDEPDSKTAVLSPTRVQINERSLRLTAGGVEPLQRAEAFYRFPEGQKNFLGYKEMRLWARGIGPGWGDDGELQFYVKIGRDAQNFYMYRTPLNGGTTRTAWLPEIQVDFAKIIALRSQVQNAFLKGTERNTCTGIDSLLITASVPAGDQPFAACADGYIVYMADPVATAPNLAAVQELSVGMVRIPTGGGAPIIPSDTLELWVDDIRLGGVVDQPGLAAQLGATIIASDFADVRINLTRRDAHFRQLAERPSFLTSSGIEVSTAFRLEKLFPRSFALAVPVTVNYTLAADDPLYLSQSDIQADVVEGLRSPRASAASYTLQVRRAEQVGGSITDVILDNLTLSSTYTRASSRTEYQTGNASRFTLGLDFNASRALFPEASRWLPADLYLTSVYTRSHDDRRAFLTPGVELPEDPQGALNRAVTGLTKRWRNGAVIAFRPMNGMSGRLDVATVRDLRTYDHISSLAFVESRDRNTVAGLDVGAERERAMQSSLSVAPHFSSWLRPRFNFSGSYTMVRDPNAPLFTLQPQSETQFDRAVPRRLSNTQTVTTGSSLDWVALFTAIDSAGLGQRFAGAIRPLDVNLHRTVLSLYDATSASAPLSYQFGIGGAADFRSIGGSPATAVGVNNQLTVNQEVRLPLGAWLVGRYHHITLRNWTRRFDRTHAVTDGSQVSFPDLALRWAGTPRGFADVWSSLSLSAGYVATEQNFGTPLGTPSPTDDDRTVLRIWRYPVTAAAVWQAVPGLTTSLTIARTRRDEMRPGLEMRARSADVNLDIAKPWTLPGGLSVNGPLRTRLSYQSGDISNFVVNPQAIGNLSRITENGRRAWTFSADTDVAENLASSFVISQVLSFDRNLNRRFTQTILSAVLHMQFFGGN